MIGILLGIVAGLLANELCEFSPWCARKLVRWSAFRQYTDRDRAEVRAEEWTRVINDRPGNLFKLITAVGFAAGGVIVSGRRAVGRDATAKRVEQLAHLAAKVLIRFSLISIPNVSDNEVFHVVREYLSALVEDSQLKDLRHWIEHVPGAKPPPVTDAMAIPDAQRLEKAAAVTLAAELAADGIPPRFWHGPRGKRSGVGQGTRRAPA